MLKAEWFRPVLQLWQPTMDDGKRDSASPTASGHLPDDTDVGDAEATGVIIDYPGGSPRFYFPPPQRVGLSTLFTLLALAFGCAAAFGFATGHWLKAAGVSVVALIFVEAALSERFLRSEVRTQPGELTLRRGLWLGRDRCFPLSQITRIEVKKVMQFGGSSYCRLLLNTRDGKSRIIAGGLRGQRNSEALAEQLREAIGLREA